MLPLLEVEKGDERLVGWLGEGEKVLVVERRREEEEEVVGEEAEERESLLLRRSNIGAPFFI